MPHIRNLRASHMEQINRRTTRVENRSPLRNGAMVEGTLTIGGTARIIYEGDDNLPAIPVATPSRTGLMPAADKAKLDAATANNATGTLVSRNSTGHFNVAAPTGTSHPVRLADLNAVSGTVTTLSNTAVIPRGFIVPNADMNNLTSAGVYDLLSDNVGTINNRPDGAADATMIVVTVSSNGLITQEWTRCRGQLRKWLRARSITDTPESWSAWAQLI